MAIIPISKSNFDTFTLTTNPTRYFHSSSLGVTGSVYVVANASLRERDLGIPNAYVDSALNDTNIESFLASAQAVGRSCQRSRYKDFWNVKFANTMQTYMSQIHKQSTPYKNTKCLEVQRFTPSVRWTDNTYKKLYVKDVLNCSYRVANPTAQWAYTNYNCLNFFTSSGVPSSSALIYPMTVGVDEHVGYYTGSYIPSGAFSIDFYINPRYKATQPGTILHVSSTFAVSIFPGSGRDENDLPTTFGLMLQLSHSADIVPSTAYLLSSTNYPNDLIFKSTQNILKYNNWHHVIMRWGTTLLDRGSGSFVVDNQVCGEFVIPSGTIAPKIISGCAGPHALFVGNYFESNGAINTFNHDSNFFCTSVAQRDGLIELQSALDYDEPQAYKLRHPLNAELHDISIKRYYMDDYDIQFSSSVGPKALDTGSKGIAFYLPPFFLQESPFRKFVGDHGGILQTPFFEIDGVTDDPFNVALSFGVNGHYINVENFVKDFASNVYPRLHHLTGSAITYTTQTREANAFLYDDPFVRKRNLTILPCDDGNFIPSYELLMSESQLDKFVDDLGNEDFSLIHLDNLLNENALLFGTDFQSINGEDDKADVRAEAFVNEQIGFSPENPGLRPGSAVLNYKSTIDDMVGSGTFDAGVQLGAPLTIYNRTKDASSNQVTFFDISNLFYGDNILRKSFVLTDPQLTGSNNHISITLKDDGYGNLYRADSLTKHATWNNVGNIYYAEGVVVIKSPHLYFFGKDEFETTFQGERNVHILNVNVLADRNQINSSSNPNWLHVSASASPVQYDQDFVYITGINFHDENMNVVMKTQLAQPIMKRFSNRILFKNKIDW